ncbi:Hypothetical predicted protein [Cloeon dipterum]|uniref:Uncharacterized protein n=1 Tax=Cloeon dipterum TaxID=197152 RepID=A0A8S1CDX2_9INSE|nr:Hypothetical predicted protein [Cloeon dipterum]
MMTCSVLLCSRECRLRGQRPPGDDRWPRPHFGDSEHLVSWVRLRASFDWQTAQFMLVDCGGCEEGGGARHSLHNSWRLRWNTGTGSLSLDSLAFTVLSLAATATGGWRARCWSEAVIEGPADIEEHGHISDRGAVSEGQTPGGPAKVTLEVGLTLARLDELAAFLAALLRRLLLFASFSGINRSSLLQLLDQSRSLNASALAASAAPVDSLLDHIHKFLDAPQHFIHELLDEDVLGAALQPHGYISEF